MAQLFFALKEAFSISLGSPILLLETPQSLLWDYKYHVAFCFSLAIVVVISITAAVIQKRSHWVHRSLNETAPRLLGSTFGIHLAIVIVAGTDTKNGISVLYLFSLGMCWALIAIISVFSSLTSNTFNKHKCDFKIRGRTYEPYIEKDADGSQKIDNDGKPIFELRENIAYETDFANNRRCAADQSDIRWPKIWSLTNFLAAISFVLYTIFVITYYQPVLEK